jgi:hypothetical protein
MPGPADSLTRAYERATGALVVTNPISQTLHLPSSEHLAQAMANLTEFKILHMLTADPLRTPTYTTFAQPDYYVEDQSSVPSSLASCGTSANPATDCVVETPGFNWNHGNVQAQISTTWVGMVGPGVAARGVDGPTPMQEALGERFGTFADHTDIRPTMLQLLGLHDDYTSDGRVLIEDLADSALPPALRSGAPSRALYILLAQLYKQLNAPLGAFDQATLQVSTAALESNTPGDGFYNSTEAALTSLGAVRDAVARMILRLLDNAFGLTGRSAFTATDLSAANAQAQQLSQMGTALLMRAAALASQATQHATTR